MRILTLTFILLGFAFAHTARAEDKVTFEFALYFAPKPAGDVEALLKELVEKQPEELTLSAGAKAPVYVAFRWLDMADYALMPADSFKYFAIGLQESDHAAMDKAEKVFVVSFTSPKSALLKTNRAACRLVFTLAEKTGANLWDEETRQLFSLPAWKAARIESWQGDIPDVTKHVTIHTYKNPSLIRLITLGLRKFGVSDLVMTEVASQQSRAAGNLINAAMQRLGEGAFPERRRLDLKIGDIRHDAVRTKQSEDPGENAKGAVLIEFKTAVRQDGDPSNELWELDFPAAEGKTPTERQQFAFDAVYGSTEKVLGIEKGDPEMAAASAKARKAFFKNEAKYRAGLGANEHLLVKAGFPYGEDNNEYMWVEVTAWKNDAVLGVLVNDPYYIKGLKSGSKVTITLDRIYDYLFYRADGTTEGNETSRILEKREAAR
ncbi:MAG: DUF2314 domain-containing protein [Nibricoccus sp.]